MLASNAQDMHRSGSGLRSESDLETLGPKWVNVDFSAFATGLVYPDSCHDVAAPHTVNTGQDRTSRPAAITSPVP